MGKKKVQKLTPKQKKDKKEELKLIMKKLEQIKNQNKGNVQKMTPITELSQLKKRIKKPKTVIRAPESSSEEEPEEKIIQAPKMSIFNQDTFEMDPSLIKPIQGRVRMQAELSLEDVARKELGNNMNFDAFLEKPLKISEQVESESQQLNAPSPFPQLPIPLGHLPIDRTLEISTFRSQLPIISKEQEIVELVNNNLVILICGETGSGKSTQIPQFLYEKNYPSFGMIAVTQPRRLAAIALAQRVSEEMNIPLGSTVGYQVRHQKVDNPGTQIKFLTDGILLNEISSDLLLKKYSVVVIDEAHERKVNSDLLVGLLSKLVLIRYKMSKEGMCHPLRLVIMSATMRVEDFNNKTLFQRLPPIVRVEARMFPVTTYFAKVTPQDYVDEAVKKCVKIHKTLPPGDVLIFLTGKEEIIKMSKLLSIALEESRCNEERQEEVQVNDEIEYEKANEEDPEIEAQQIQNNQGQTDTFQIMCLYSSLPLDEQRRVFKTSEKRRFIISTNIAETSLTIPNIRYVVDSGHEKYKHFNKIWRWYIGWGSQAMAEQRAGRAGRVAHGYCYRLYSTAVFVNKMQAFPSPEITKIPLQNVILQLKSVGIQDVLRFPFPTNPDRPKMIESINNLIELKAVEGEPVNVLSLKDQTKITQLGRVLSFIPLEPVYGKLLLLGRAKGVPKFVLYLVLSLTVETLLSHSSRITYINQEDLERGDDSGEDNKDVVKMFSKAKEKKEQIKHKNMRERTEKIIEFKTKYGKFYSPGADAFLGMNIVGEYFAELLKLREAQSAHFSLDSSTREICSRDGLIENSMKEVFRNGEQIIQIYQTMTNETLDYKQYTHPSKQEIKVLLGVLLQIYHKNIAYHENKSLYKVAEEQFVYLHASSFLYAKPPIFLGYLDVFQSNEKLNEKSNNKMYMKYPFEVKDFGMLAREHGKVNPPDYHIWDGRLFGIASGEYKTWPLGPFRVQTQGKEMYYHIGRLLLQGKIIPQFSQLKSNCNHNFNIINPNNKSDTKVSGTVSILSDLKLSNDNQFKMNIEKSPEFLLDILKLWTQKENSKKINKIYNSVVNRYMKKMERS